MASIPPQNDSFCAGFWEWRMTRITYAVWSWFTTGVREDDPEQSTKGNKESRNRKATCLDGHKSFPGRSELLAGKLNSESINLIVFIYRLVSCILNWRQRPMGLYDCCASLIKDSEEEMVDQWKKLSAFRSKITYVPYMIMFQSLSITLIRLRYIQSVTYFKGII